MSDFKKRLLSEYDRQHGRDDWQASLGDSLPLSGTFERRRPSRVGDLRGDWALPLLQSLTTAAAGAVIGGLLWGWGSAPKAGVVTFAIVWGLLLIDTRQALWLFEKVTRKDWSGDHVIGKPPTFRVEVKDKHNGGYRLSYYDFPIAADKMREVARAILIQGANFSRPGLSEVLSQNEYNKLAPMMVDAGLAVALPGNKRELTSAGRSLLRQLVK